MTETAGGGRRRKRSGRLPALAALVGVVSGCAGGPAPMPEASALEMVKARYGSLVGVLANPEDRAAGVHGWPLVRGESLLFVYPAVITPTFSMENVSYDLALYALDPETLDPLGVATMPACDAGPECEHTIEGVETTLWLEVRLP